LDRQRVNVTVTREINC